MIKGCIFDLDGTLLDSQWVWKSSTEELLEELGIYNSQQVYETIRSFSLDEAVNYIITTYHLKMTPAEVINKVSNLVKSKYDYQVQLKTGAYEKLLQFKKEGKKMVIATASEYEYIMPCLIRLKINELMEAVITTSQYSTNKREPLIYDKATAIMQLKKEEVLVFEDALHAIETLKKFQYQVCAIYEEEEKNNQLQIKQLADIWIENWKDLDLSYIQSDNK